VSAAIQTVKLISTFSLEYLSKIKTDGAAASTASGYKAERHSPRITTQETPDNWTSNMNVDTSSEI
jgi:hypothetical protein